MAREVEASDDAKAFDKAFKKVTAKPPKQAAQEGVLAAARKAKHAPARRGR